MAKYTPADDGKTIDGKVVVFLNGDAGAQAPDGAAAGSGRARADEPGGPAGDGGASSAPGWPNGSFRPNKPAAATSPGNVKLPAKAKTDAIDEQAANMVAASQDGTPFCEECEAARKAMASQPDEE